MSKIHHSLPDVVRTLCWNVDAWIVGSAAENFRTAKDWDVIVPHDRWSEAALICISHSPTANSFGGWKLHPKTGETIDVWPCSLDQYLITAPNVSQLFTVQPKRGLYVNSNNVSHSLFDPINCAMISMMCKDVLKLTGDPYIDYGCSLEAQSDSEEERDNKASAANAKKILIELEKLRNRRNL